ncbi:MAG: hypothetical protein IIU63_02195, partial [Clostridia bacterium]|nr:hypothetical protein [Clostridia bacterium]
MKQKKLFLKTTLALALSFVLLTAGMLHIFAGNLPAQDVDQEGRAPEMPATGDAGDQTLENNDTATLPDGSDIVIDDGSKPATLEQLA